MEKPCWCYNHTVLSNNNNDYFIIIFLITITILLCREYTLTGRKHGAQQRPARVSLPFHISSCTCKQAPSHLPEQFTSHVRSRIQLLQTHVTTTTCIKYTLNHTTTADQTTYINTTTTNTCNYYYTHLTTHATNTHTRPHNYYRLDHTHKHNYRYYKLTATTHTRPYTHNYNKNTQLLLHIRPHTQTQLLQTHSYYTHQTSCESHRTHTAGAGDLNFVSLSQISDYAVRPRLSRICTHPVTLYYITILKWHVSLKTQSVNISTTHLRWSNLDGESAAGVREVDDFLPRPAVDAEPFLVDTETIGRHSDVHVSFDILSVAHLYKVANKNRQSTAQQLHETANLLHMLSADETWILWSRNTINKYGCTMKYLTLMKIFKNFMEILKYFKISLNYFMKFLIFIIKWLNNFLKHD